MLSPFEFRQKWDPVKNGKLINFSFVDLEEVSLSTEVKMFLIEAGLPESASPYLEFRTSQNLSFKNYNNSESIDDYFCIGTTGAGDFICVKTSSGNIVYLDSGNQNREVFINSSINQFTECLLFFSSMIDKAIETNGEDAYLDNNIPSELLDWIMNEITRIDSQSLREGNFWNVELEDLKNE